MLIEISQSECRRQWGTRIRGTPRRPRACPTRSVGSATKSYFRARAAARHEIALFREGFGAAGFGAFAADGTAGFGAGTAGLAVFAGSIVVAGWCFCAGSGAFGATGSVVFAVARFVDVGSSAFAVAGTAAFVTFGEGFAAFGAGTPRATALSPASRPIRCASRRLLP